MPDAKTDSGIPTLPEQFAPGVQHSPIIPIPNVSARLPRLGDPIEVYTADGYQLLHDRCIDFGPRAGIVAFADGSPCCNVTVFMDNSRTVGEPTGTVQACPVYDPLSEDQREYLRKKPDSFYWAEWAPAR